MPVYQNNALYTIAVEGKTVLPGQYVTTLGYLSDPNFVLISDTTFITQA
jgi:hypothetical protein